MRSARLGIVSGNNVDSYSSARQQVSVPQSAFIRLSWRGFPRSDPLDTADSQYASILNANGVTLRTVWRATRDDRAWLECSYDLSEFAGQTITVNFTARNDGLNGRTALYVDDIRADVSAITAATRLIEVAPVIVYARRLELGQRKDGRPFVISAPPHLVEETAMLLAQRYRDLASIKHAYLQLASNARGLRGRARRAAESAMRYPAIAIRPLPA